VHSRLISSRLLRWSTSAVAAGVLVAVLPGPASAADPGALSVHVASGEQGEAPGQPDAFNDASLDGSTWTDAVVVAPQAGYATITGTQWISSDAGAGATRTGVTWFRRLFSLPPGVTTSNGQVCVHADNLAVVSFNGTTVVTQTDNTSAENFSGSPSCGDLDGLARSGLNTLLFSVDNSGGPMGLDFEADIDYLQAPGTLPELRLPEDIVVDATSPAGTSVGYGSVIAIDATGGSLIADCTPPPGLFAVGTTTVTCTATGVNGPTTGTFTITVLPFETANQPPVLSLPPNLTAHTTSLSGKRITYTATASDDSGIPPAVVCLPPSGSMFRVGVTTVTCTATDDRSLTGTGTFTVTVIGPLERACALLEQSLGSTLKSRLLATLRAAADNLHQARRYADESTIRSLAVKVKNSAGTHLRPALRGSVVRTVTRVLDRVCCLAPAQ
jgi:hypothetical protein